VPQGSAPVVVGVDGSEAARAALRWAAEEAAAHHVPLIAVYVSDPRSRRAPYAGAPPDADEPDPAATLEREIVRSGAIHAVRAVEVGVPAELLLRRAIGARVLVLGHADHRRRHDGDAQFPRGPALGSIARACVARAACPVVVVPIPARSTASAATVPAPRCTSTAQSPALVGGRAIYPRQQPVPVAHR